MKKVCLFAVVAGLGLVSAAPPSTGDTEAAEASGGYPPCSATVTDRCIQLYERGVRTSENLAANGDLGPGRGPAQGGPEEPEMASGGDYPPCSATVTDRCTQTYEGRRSHRRNAARAIRMAGERG
jgi:hypothetical protein